MSPSARAVIAFRSGVYLAAFYISSALFLVLGSWLLLGPRSWAMAGLKAHGRASVLLLRVICGTRMAVRGQEKLPPGPVIVASKHQAAWDTFALTFVMRDPALIMKAELMSIPLYGWFSRKFEMIPIRRELGGAAMRAMVKEARTRVEDRREIVIFPEGTRTMPDAPPDYKPGILLLYEALKLPVCPVALNSGVCWPRRSRLRYPGTITVEFLDPIPAGLPRAEMMARLEAAIEPATARLVAEARAELAAKGYTA
jgi:1-acyl-sn-glycerol-3-phosphate acyltransferase